MNFQDRLAGDPLGALAGCLVWVPIAVWVISTIHWLVGGEIDGLFAVVSLSVAIGLGMVAINPPAPSLSPLILAAAVATVVLFPMVRVAMNRHALAAIDVEQLDKAFENLLTHPNSPALQIRVAELLFIRGLRANALAIGQAALKHLPKAVFRAEHQMVSSWQLQVNQGESPKTRCPHCGFENGSTDLLCQKCHRPFVIEYARGTWLGRVSAEKVIVLWMGLIMAFVGIPAATHFAKTNPGLALFAIIGQVVVGLVLMVVAFLRGSS